MSQDYKLIKPDDIVGDSYTTINSALEAVRSGFEGDNFPEEPVKGQRCYKDSIWYSYDGKEWIKDTDTIKKVVESIRKFATKQEVSEITNSLKNFATTESLPALLKFATSEEAREGIIDDKVMSPAAVKKGYNTRRNDRQ
jgi:hypothetical protein